MENNRKFAEDNAGKYFLYYEVRVRVVGYYAKGVQILVSVPKRVKRFGWDKSILDSDDVFVVNSKAQKYLYVPIKSLKKWIRK